MKNAKKEQSRPLKKKKETFDSTIEIFGDEIIGLSKTFPLIHTSLDLVIARQEKDIEKVAQDLEEQSKAKKKPNINVMIELIQNAVAEIKKTTPILRADKILSDGYQIMLVTRFESFLGDLIKVMYETKPQILYISDKNLDYKTILTHNSIQEIRDDIIYREVEDALRKNPIEIFEWLETKTKIEIIKNMPNWDLVVEIFERRNILVHSDGKVSEQYLKICRESGYNLSKKIKVGSKLIVDEEYFSKACECIFITGSILSQLIRRKLEESNDLADQSIVKTSFELINDKKYESAINLIDFAINTFDLTEKAKLMLIINKAISLKFKNNDHAYIELLDTIEWDSKDDIYKIANFALRKDFKKASSLMEAIGSKKISKHSYKTWPIFDEFRKSPEFSKSYKEVFKEKFIDEATNPQRIDEVIKDLKKQNRNLDKSKTKN